MVCQLIFWLVPQFHVSAVAVALQGFFLGPMFPAAVVAATKILPAYLHVSAIGFAAAFGGGGAAVLPFAIGALAQTKGVAILQPVILAILALLVVLWMCLPILNKVAASETGSESSKPEGQWFNVDIDLVETSRRTIRKARGGG
jgi:fucose permease